MLNPAMLSSRTYHLICNPTRCIKVVTDILAKREMVMNEHPDMQTTPVSPIFVWEPMEGSCRPTELSSFYQALRFVDVFSPNEHELDLLFNGLKANENEVMPIGSLQHLCKRLLTQGSEKKPSAVIVRTGAAGCVVASHQRLLSFPAYHRPPIDCAAEKLAAWHDRKTKTWDITGGGNAFLGGFCMGLLSWSNDQVNNHGFTDFEFAAVYGSVAASFAIEQVGMPNLSRRKEDGKELWNEDGK